MHSTYYITTLIYSLFVLLTICMGLTYRRQSLAQHIRASSCSGSRNYDPFFPAQHFSPHHNPSIQAGQKPKFKHSFYPPNPPLQGKKGLFCFGALHAKNAFVVFLTATLHRRKSSTQCGEWAPLWRTTPLTHQRDHRVWVEESDRKIEKFRPNCGGTGLAVVVST